MGGIALRPVAGVMPFTGTGQSPVPRGGAFPLATAAVKGPGRISDLLRVSPRAASSLVVPIARPVRTARKSRPQLQTTGTAIAAVDRRFGAPLTLRQIGQISQASPPGVVLSRTLALSELEEGLNTLVVAVTPPSAPAISVSCAFFANAAPAPAARPRPGRITLPNPAPAPVQKPIKIAGKFLLAPKAGRLKVVAAQKTAIEQKGREQRGHLAVLSKSGTSKRRSEPRRPRRTKPEG